jgi:hypothetical protein
MPPREHIVFPAPDVAWALFQQVHVLTQLLQRLGCSQDVFISSECGTRERKLRRGSRSSSRPPLLLEVLVD